MKRPGVTLFGLVILLMMGGCSSLTRLQQEQEAGGPAQAFNKEIQIIAIEMVNRLREFDPTDRTVAVTTFVDLDNFEETSSFGRYVAEDLGMELFKLGFRLREIRQRVQIKITPEVGEVALTRDSAALMRSAQVDAVVTGAYSRFGDQVVVNARLIDVDTGRVVSAGQMVVGDYFGGPVGELLDQGRPGRSIAVPVIPMKPGA
ncbi:MAG: hypothetical protein HQK87_02625 [Nitrospinae bacterium]|nr:hypothetical protein [Nitrospinota bacterium]